MPRPQQTVCFLLANEHRQLTNLYWRITQPQLSHRDNDLLKCLRVFFSELPPLVVVFNARETSARLHSFIHDKRQGASARELKNISLCAGLHRDRGCTDARIVLDYNAGQEVQLCSS